MTGWQACRSMRTCQCAPGGTPLPTLCTLVRILSSPRKFLRIHLTFLFSRHSLEFVAAVGGGSGRGGRVARHQTPCLPWCTILCPAMAPLATAHTKQHHFFPLPRTMMTLLQCYPFSLLVRGVPLGSQTPQGPHPRAGPLPRGAPRNQMQR